MPGTLIFGGTGSLGRKLIERLLPHGCVTVYSRDEAKHWSLRNEFSAGPLAKRLQWLQFVVGDVRDPDRVAATIRKHVPSHIIIAAALKQVDTCELSPDEAVKTNLYGTQNIIDAVNVSQFALETVLFVSTDKACAPVNVYGMCKAISERIVTSQANDAFPGYLSPKFLAVRYGNVLESRGSIIPLFKYQGLNNECLTVTDPNMTRFLMTLDQSVDLIQHTIKNGKSGETWIPRLPAMKIGHLADIFSKQYNKPIKYIGLRPGEKLHEDLVNESESVRTRLTDDKQHYVIGPAYIAGAGDRFVYSSDQDVYTRQETCLKLKELNILDAPLEQFKGLAIEEIVTNRQS
jgi:UDP-N-acetylglucosamine 4,6-dehydratase/5-epimerase